MRSYIHSLACCFYHFKHYGEQFPSSPHPQPHPHTTGIDISHCFQWLYKFQWYEHATDISTISLQIGIYFCVTDFYKQ